jgi:hypothetical protein
MQGGYHVIFLSRESSVQPFVRTIPPLKCADEMAQALLKTSDGNIRFCEDAQKKITPVWGLLQQAVIDKRLLTLHYVTVFEYLAYLEAVARALEVCDSSCGKHFCD